MQCHSPKAIEHLLLHTPEKVESLHLRARDLPWARCEELGVQQGILILECREKESFAMVAAFNPGGLEALSQKMEEPGFWFILDHIQDPRNFGAICRSAEAFGALGIIYPKDRSVPLTEVVLATSAGAIATLPLYRVPNLGEVCRRFKKKGIWIANASLGEKAFPPEHLKGLGKVAIILGSEGEGTSSLLKSLADFSVEIPMVGKIESLNVSVAAALLCYVLTSQNSHRNSV